MMEFLLSRAAMMGVGVTLLAVLGGAMVGFNQGIESHGLQLAMDDMGEMIAEVDTMGVGTDVELVPRLPRGDGILLLAPGSLAYRVDGRYYVTDLPDGIEVLGWDGGSPLELSPDCRMRVVRSIQDGEVRTVICPALRSAS